jgi:hypothetical protein
MLDYTTEATCGRQRSGETALVIAELELVGLAR